MPERIVSCEVALPKNKRFGVFANAFRVLQDAGPEYLLDFLVYSEAEKSATVVARLRVLAPMLPAIRERLGATMKEVGEKKQASGTTIVPVFMPPKGELH